MRIGFLVYRGGEVVVRVSWNCVSREASLSLFSVWMVKQMESHCSFRCCKKLSTVTFFVQIVLSLSFLTFWSNCNNKCWMCNKPFYSCLLSDVAFEWQRGRRWPCFDTYLTTFVCKFVGLMQTSLHLNEKSRDFCIIAKSLAFIGQVTEHTTAKWPICEKTVKAVE